MGTPKIKTFNKITPMIYAYETPNDVSHKGWIKIGYTESKTVEERIKEQSHTVDAKVHLLWKGNARYQDGSDEIFTDHDFHNYLVNKKGVERKENTEWFKIDGDTSHNYFYKFTENNFDDVQNINEGSNYVLRDEQKNAVEKTTEYFKNSGPGSEFLWNAKPRFGKTLTSYDLVINMKLKNVLIVTNRPSISNSWFDDFKKFISWKYNYYFVSDSDSLKGKGVLNRAEYLNTVIDSKEKFGQIAFESLQGLKGSKYFNGSFDKLKWIRDTKWDLLIIDEAHEGIDTYKTSAAFENINRKFTLHLSGTPFKALASGKFSDEQIFNWSYEDEQNAKMQWNKNENENSNPYIQMPTLNMYTYQMSKMIKDKVIHKVDINDENIDPTFDLNEFFSTDSEGNFIYNDYVDNFLDALTNQKKYPFSTEGLRATLKHTFWILDRVASAIALKEKLENHHVFKDYKIILAAGKESLNGKSSFDAVRESINKFDKTITLSVGQLTTGVTIKPWSAVMMLSNMHSPSEYMQAAFRSQTPYVYKDIDGNVRRKTNSYVFDFDPTRTLEIVDEYANDLSSDKTIPITIEKRKSNIRKLLNFFPVIGEDRDGEMIKLNSNDILTIPRRIKSNEVVNHGFINNFLFSNISNIFGAPREVNEILSKIKLNNDVPVVGLEDNDIDRDGNVEVDDKKVIGKSKDLFGDKVYERGTKSDDKDLNVYYEKILNEIKTDIIDYSIDKVKGSYNFTNTVFTRIKKEEEKTVSSKLNKIIQIYKEKKVKITIEKDNLVSDAKDKRDLDAINNIFSKKLDNINLKLQRDIDNFFNEQVKVIPQSILFKLEKEKGKKKKIEIESQAREHLRSLSRSIPSFIMAYGDRNLRLDNFDEYTENEVFFEVTGITLDDFRFLRDGGDCLNTDGTEMIHFKGNLFDEVVFNDSIQLFLDKKESLSNYFEDKNDEDIFDYIPEQKNNQKFTPRKVVKMMVDELEKNDPNVFSDPTKTFCDIFIKSGLYIAEIVKRIYNNKKIIELYPDENERINHIMNHQIYGFAPTRIIYLIAINYIFGFKEKYDESLINKHFKNIDTTNYVKEHKLTDLIKKEFLN